MCFLSATFPNAPAHPPLYFLTSPLNQILCDTTWDIGSCRGGRGMESDSLCRCSMSHSAPEILLPARHSVYLVLLIDRRYLVCF